MYDTIKIEKGLYGISGKTFTQALTELDPDDKYSYVYSSPSAAKRELVRHKYQNLDRQWFSDPVGGLKFKNMFSERGLNYFYVKIPGFNGADIRSRVSCEKTIDGEKFGTREVSKLRVSYSKKGMFTTMWFYTDGYTN